MSIEKIAQTLRRDFGGRLVVVSNREPYIHDRTPEGVKVRRPAGGLTSALDPLLRSSGGLWVGWGSGDADRECSDEQGRCPVPPEDPQYTLKRVWLSPEEVRGHYYGFSNQTLWPLCHLRLDKTRFRARDWEVYRRVNQTFAQAVFESELREEDVVWFQDYHLALAPAFLREREPRLPLMQFWHIPWPPWDVFRACPWREELLSGLLSNDLLGFQLDRFCQNFLDCASQGLGAGVVKGRGVVRYRGRETLVAAFPISIDYGHWSSLARSRAREAQAAAIRKELGGGGVLGIGVDRLDYTKGIAERFRAIERFLERYPRHQNRFQFVQVAVPSRTRIQEYRDLRAAVEERINHANDRFGGKGPPPIRYLYRNLPSTELAALYRAADFCLVSSLHDGMNLVAKEFIACQVERRGVLVCSEFAGAAEEFDNALLVNPFDTEGFADTICWAIEMSPEAKELRMSRLQEHLGVHDIYRWMREILVRLARFKRRAL
ncbi:MAG: trehalose-6-phosphate synthase, partial [Nitrospinota bacterium]